MEKAAAGLAQGASSHVVVAPRAARDRLLAAKRFARGGILASKRPVQITNVTSKRPSCSMPMTTMCPACGLAMCIRLLHSQPQVVVTNPYILVESAAVPDEGENVFVVPGSFFRFSRSDSNTWQSVPGIGGSGGVNSS